MNLAWVLAAVMFMPPYIVKAWTVSEADALDASMVQKLGETAAEFVQSSALQMSIAASVNTYALPSALDVQYSSIMAQRRQRTSYIKKMDDVHGGGLCGLLGCQRRHRKKAMMLHHGSCACAWLEEESGACVAASI